MPNWSSNTIALKGTKEQVLNFLNFALEEKETDVLKAFNKVFEGNESITLGTFRPMPKTYTEFDTTNDVSKTFVKNYLKGDRVFATDCVPDYVKELKNQGCTDEDKIRKTQERYEYDYKAAKAYQEKEYGAVGWYEYNCDVRFGCKWDAEMEGVGINENKDVFIITFDCQTPWCIPNLWCDYMQKQFGLQVYICAFEESGEYYFYGKFEGNMPLDVVNMDEPDHNEEDEDWDMFYIELEEAKESFRGAFFDFVWEN